MLRMSLQVAHLASRALVQVRDADWREFLQGLLTQDVASLQPGELRFAALLTPQGRLLFDLFVLGLHDGAILDVEAARRDALIQRLSIYRLRAKVEIAPDDGRVWAAWGSETADPPWIADPRLAALGYRAYGPPPRPETANEDDHSAWRLSLGVPDPARDAYPDKTYPIEADFDLLNGLDFRKGCYVGQETTSRMKRRGEIRTRTLPIVFDGAPPAPGAEILAGELRAGQVLTGGLGRAMALVRLDRIRGVELTVDGRPVRAEAPEWLELD
jgi:folate-binding protein YgfZ